MAEGERLAVVLCNLGGPDGQAAVEPFLFNLFNDRAIIGLPLVLRWPLAKLIAGRRAPTAREIYSKIGGGSPLLANTEAQAAALVAALRDLGAVEVFIAMRYWSPLTEETVAAVKAWGATRIVVLPLYPQFSTTTTASSWSAWRRAAARARLAVPTTLVCCYPREAGFVAALAARVRDGIAVAESRTARGRRLRVLFSAHGLPKKIVERGDPYPWQVEATSAAVAAAIGREDIEWQVCYQSRVGPLAWIGPATDREIERAGHEGVGLVVVPLAFVSEHSETLVELDIEYGALAERSGVPVYVRVPTVSTMPDFIAGLASLVRAALGAPGGVEPGCGQRVCPERLARCALSPGSLEA